MKDYKNLIVWQKAHNTALCLYKISEKFPPTERYGITSQIRRSAVSVPTNIAEGCGHQSKKEFARYLQIASGSASETEYLITLAKDLSYLSEEEYFELFSSITEIKKMLFSLIEKTQMTIRNTRQLTADR